MSVQRLPRLSTTARAILAEFAASYPESAHFRGGRKLRKAGWEKIFPQIERDVEAKVEFLDAVEELGRIGVLTAKWKRFRDGTEVEALILEDPKRLFELLGQQSPESIRNEMLAVLSGDDWKSGPDLLASVRDHLRVMLEASHPVPVDSPLELADLARLFRITRADAASLPIRALSVRLFSDSKRLEHLLPIADRLSRRVIGVAVSDELDLARSYPEVSFALLGALTFSDPGRDTSRTWMCNGEVMTLPGATMESLADVEVLPPAGGSPPAALSVENKETFYTLAARLRGGRLGPEIGAVAYCGGHPGRHFVRLMALFAEAGVALRHFGDLDPDGLLILSELSDALVVPVEPWHMDVVTYRRYLEYGYRPPAARIELLKASLGKLPGHTAELAGEIVRMCIGVEQEVVDLDT